MTPLTAVSIGTFTSADIGTVKALSATYSIEFDTVTNMPVLHINPTFLTDSGYHAVHYSEGGAVASEPSEFYILITGGED